MTQSRATASALATQLLLLFSLCFATTAHANERIVTEDIQYVTRPGVDPSLLSLDVHSPANAKNLPVVLFVHGGAWRMWSKEKHNKKKSALFVREGYVFVSINYRLSPEYQHPAHTEDLASALLWVHQNIAGYGGDPSNITLMGHSAGAQMVALVVSDPKYFTVVGVNPKIIRSVIAIDGGAYDIERRLQQENRRLPRPFLDAFTEDPSVWKDASPCTHLNAGAPPFLLIYAGDRPASVSQMKIFVEASQKNGISVEVFHDTKDSHIGVNKHIGAPQDETTKVILDFLSRR